VGFFFKKKKKKMLVPYGQISAARRVAPLTHGTWSNKRPLKIIGDPGEPIYPIYAICLEYSLNIE
jgi:hypothetical protein